MDFTVELGTNVLGHNFLDIIDLDVMEQTIIEDVMAEISTTEHVSLSDPILSCNHGDEDIFTSSSTDSVVPVAMVTNNKPVIKDVIKASDVEGLLEQFEEASNDLCTEISNKDNTIESKTEILTFHTVEESSCNINNNGTPPKKELTNEVLQKLKSSRKPKTTVMLPMVVPAKRGRGRAMTRGHPVAMPANCTPRRLQRVMMQNSEIKDSLALVEEVVVTSDKINHNSDGGRKMESLLKKNNIVISTDSATTVVNNNTHVVAIDNSNVKEARTNDDKVTVDLNYFEQVPDHDYIRSVPSDNKDIKDDRKLVDHKDYEDGEICDDVDNGYRDNDAHDRDVKCREDDTVNAHLFDKLPSYYTALSIPRKQVKKTASCVTGRGGITIQDYIQRDISPDRDPNAYSKLPDYFSMFTNSTRYDSKYDEKLPKFSESSSENEGYSNLTQSSTFCERNVSSRHSSRSRSRSRSESRSKSNHKSQGRRQSSYSSYSGYSSSGSSCSRSSCSHRSRSNSSDSSRSRSSSCSTCSSRSSSAMSRSPSRSPDRNWQRERNFREQRRELHKEHSTRRKSRNYGRERSRSRSRRYSYTRSRSRDYRSRSRSVSRHHRRDSESVSRHRKRDSASKERFREERRKEREEEKQQQMKERRIVYVGGLPSGYSRHTLRDLFTRFGPIERVQLHFRERGDNYGFVTFTYTCDAYAAIEKGRNIPGLEKFDLCFGGRRQFCDVEYADLDGNKEIEEEFDSKPQATSSFDELLRQAKAKIKKS
ncbi:nuclear receptor transcription coactivator [Mactra antiquata]